MRRVTRWGKLTNNQVTRWVGSRHDMRAHSTQKTRTEARCSHKPKTQAHGQQQSPAMCKRHEHAANEETHKSRVHTRYDNMKHTANKNTNCVQHHKAHMNKRPHGRANSRPHTHTMRQNVERECPNPVTKTKTMSARIRTPHYNTKTRHADERPARLEHTPSRALT